ncbi:unnamed protein product [Chrysoparadoxa australica]
MDLVGKVALINPDYYSVWNYRRESILDTIKQEGRANMSHEELQAELTLTVKAIKRNPKSYSAWHHRQWSLKQGLDQFFKEMESHQAGSEGAEQSQVKPQAKEPAPEPEPEEKEQDRDTSILQNELELCQNLLEMDGRNFHCWTYRQWIVSLMDLPASEEFAFTTKKINQNFSNYSAFHCRSKLLPKYALERGDTWGVIHEELDMVHQAVFTEPDDQSAWWYHRFVVHYASSIPEAEGADAQSTYGALLEAEVQCVRELLEVEPACKWALVTLESLLHQQQSLASKAGHKQEQVHALGQEMAGIIQQLQEIDPGHANYYKALAL